MTSSFLRVFDALSELTPFDVDVGKTLVGNSRDGGYVTADIASSADVVSFGVGGDVSFEHAMAETGRRVFLHDHTVDGLPSAHENFGFRRVGVCGFGTDAPDLLPLEAHVAAIEGFTGAALLKMDVEGWEWEVFSSASPETLAAFDQIVLEVHWLERLASPIFAHLVTRSLRTINAQFTLFNVHANNCSELHVVSGLTVASVLELSYVRTSLVRRSASSTVYPCALNRGNDFRRRDLPLLFHPFLPLAADEAQVRAAALRVDADWAGAADASPELVNVADGLVYDVSSVLPGSSVEPFSAGPVGALRFHTDIEDEPWIRFDLSRPLPISSIVIHNRSGECQDRARSVAVSASVDGRDYEVIHAPDEFATPGTWSDALHVIMPPEAFRFVKIHLRERTCLHLECVQIFVPAEALAA